ncbi:hypothetical protein ADP71_31420 [Vitreoscilla sp. C1]|uniref:hypothetical protein n=1 Tax=Vitreoscilla sp. (strain C1) TaxID=96942 RepID=UPI000CDC37A5|nr:hypothetical protein [Vitreoscilla sp. C1]AUZ06320.1 hypothetical protein ADP71_31420 [Vitreoscilla sp. C1]
MKIHMIVAAVVATLSVQAWAVSQQDVEFANRQCAQRGEPAKCRIARDLSRAYNQQQRDQLEYDAAVRSGRPMNGSVNVYIDAPSYPGELGEYRWNHQRGQYCYHNRSGSVNRCVK